MKVHTKETILKQFMKDVLSKGETEFAYYKKNGEARVATGTTNPDLIKVWESISNREAKQFPPAVSDDSDTVVKYYDLNVNGWRSFDVNRLIEVFVDDV